MVNRQTGVQQLVNDKCCWVEISPLFKPLAATVWRMQVIIQFIKKQLITDVANRHSLTLRTRESGRKSKERTEDQVGK